MKTIKLKTIPWTPRMRDALAQLINDLDCPDCRHPWSSHLSEGCMYSDGEGEEICVCPRAGKSISAGRPTKQRLAKYGLAEYITPNDWDGEMRITDKGRRLYKKKVPDGKIKS